MARARLLVALVFIGSGCGEPVAPVAAEPEEYVAPRTARRRLEAEVKEFRAIPSPAAGELLAQRVLYGDGAPLALGLRDGWLEARAESGAAGVRLALSRLELSLEDLAFSEAQIPPSGLTFTRVRLVLERPATLALEWYGDGTVGVARGEVPVQFQAWLLLSDESESPLPRASFSVPVELVVATDPFGGLGVALEVVRPGAFWEWAGLFALGDLELRVEGAEAALPEHLQERPSVP